MQEPRQTLCLVTPALASANNGNWQTASRWARMLSVDYHVILADRWQAGRVGGKPCDAMLALHARRSSPSIQAFAQAHPRQPLIVALTGTDLYRDIAIDDDARRSLALATRLIVLQDQAPNDVPAEHRPKVDVCFQSTPLRRSVPKTNQRLRAVAVGHLRDEKDPLTLMRAMRRLHARTDIVLDHIGAPLDSALAKEAAALAHAQRNYRWLGNVPHAATLARIQRAHVLVHPSVMEGGAHVVMEAVCSGTPVLASRMAGNVGMLGADYRGYFAVGDDAALAALLVRARDDTVWLGHLTQQATTRAAWFAPERERQTLRAIVRRAFADAASSEGDAQHR